MVWEASPGQDWSHRQSGGAFDPLSTRRSTVFHIFPFGFPKEHLRIHDHWS